LLAYLETAVIELARGEERMLGAIDVIPADERQRTVVEWNATARPFPDQELIHQGFEARVRTQPNAVAVECEGARLTYLELDARANRLAHALVARGARPKTYVGLCLRRSIDLVVALLAIAKSGAAYVPLDPEYPHDRLAFMLEDAKAPFVVTESCLRDRFDGPAIVIDGDDAGAIVRMLATPPGSQAAPTDECYAIFTSGSTGKPKGVVLTHRAVVNTFDWVTRTLEVGPGDRLLFVTSPCFDLSVYDTFGALAAGATVVVATRAQLDDPELLAATILDRKITIWDSAPAALQRLATYFPPPSSGTPPSLRLVMLSGDWIPIGLPDAVRASFPKARVISLGGATEAAIWSNWFPIGELDPRWTSVPYGRPIQNARYHVLDARMRPVPLGVPGDLYIGGACLASGYLNRPELTAERFVKDPLSGIEGERLYKTGDLARYFDDGNLEFLGRADFQVKIRGYRVELGEVEAALLAVDGVREAVCTARADASGQKSLVAYLVAQPGETLVPDRVKAVVATKLTDFMVPTQIVVLDAMPLSSNGKVDRKALPDPTARAQAAEIILPRTPKEEAIAAIWRDLLRCERVGVTDNFFALGGHSLLAVMLVSRIGRELGAKLPVSRVLERPTIEGLAASIGSERPPRAVSGCHVITLNKEAPRPPLFLVSGSGGFGFVFRGTTELLAHRHPVHVLNAIGAESEEEGLDHSIEEMARIYLPQVEEAAPRGPVILGGYSFGMLVAYELAHQLRQRGRPVPLLVSFDGFAPRFPELLPLPARILIHARALLHSDANARRTYARDRWRNIRRRVLEALGLEHHSRETKIVEGDDEADRRLRRLEMALWRARGAYNPHHTMPTELLLVKTSLSEQWPGSKMDDPFYGWRRYVKGHVDVVTVPGGHHTLFDEGNQQRMADAILASTARFEERSEA
jgi:amino acid adenylation domain-containing protein